ncbi:MAG: YceI family protein [Gammaproteobacteria bacterium]|jgi:polyisoprenoid-binding protein YceI|nr:hypothetical protein [Gammaproteobacteria bacterium]MDP6095663.1 YceI family protein [Gammaproteobacteria bacterium]MDP7455229.1 YceI family protein [Gammaproteobacteria bacterium]HJO12036.1 YceI family protein [Gammaproteobacteria bacterium]
MRTLFNRAVLASFFLLIGLPVQAATWVIAPGDSRVVFQYKYGNDPYAGAFTNIDATFEFDPMRPGTCDFQVTIHIEDIEIDSPEVLDYLLDFELFDVDQWPTASFKAEKCSLNSLNAFTSEGTLTIRDQTNPLSFPFNFDIETIDGQIGFHLTSEVTIQRLDYGVGQGYWENTAEIPNDVTIQVDVYAIQQ